jgi:MFS family permease
MMTLYMLGWSVFGVFIALAQDVYTLVAARFLLGLSQAGAYPTAVLIVKRGIPDRHRGLASGIVAFGGRFGGAGVNWLTGILIVAFVPLSTPATLTPEDVLDTREFMWQRATIGASDPEWMYIVRDAVNVSPFIPPPLGDVQIEDTEEDRQFIANAVNAVIRNPNAFETLNRSNISLPVDAKKLRAIPAAQRTPAESERLNRLLIEKAFPGAIRQLHGHGWRPTMLLYGMGGIVVGALFWLLVRNWPAQHPWANAAEVALIEAGQSRTSQQAGTDAIPWGPLVTSGNQWLYSATNFFSNLGWVFLITLMPRFLDERFHVPVDQRGLMTTIPLFAAAFTVPLGGWYTDRLCRTLGRRWGRAIPMGALKLPCVAGLAISPWLPDPWTVVIALTFMSVFQDFGLPAVWAFAQDTGGRQSATVLGWANMWGNFGAGIGTILVGAMAARFGWDMALYTGAFAFLMCGITGVLANADEPLFPTEERAEA